MQTEPQPTGPSGSHPFPKYGLAFVVLALVAATAYVMFGGKGVTAPTPPPPEPIAQVPGQPDMRMPVVVKLSAQNGSGQDGTATVTEKDGQTVVVLEVKPGPKGVAQPAHIHAGTCAGGLGAVKYNLSPVIDGKSTTTLAPIPHFIHGLGQTAINVHKSVEKQDVYAACGDLTPAFDEAMLPAK